MVGAEGDLTPFHAFLHCQANCASDCKTRELLPLTGQFKAIEQRGGSIFKFRRLRSQTENLQILVF